MRTSKYILMLIVLSLASCASHELVDARNIIKYESSSSFHHLFYMGSDESYHYVFRRDKVNTHYIIPREQATFEKEFPYKSEVNEPFIMEPGTIEKAIQKKHASQ